MRAVAALKGITLAVANLSAILIGVGVAEHDHAGPILVAFAYSVVPTAALGGLFGHLLGLSTRSFHRRVLLALGAVALPAVGLAVVFPVVCVPTLAAALVFERWTRRVAPVPVATVRSLRT